MSSTTSPRDVAERVGLDANYLDKPCQECSLPLIAPFVHPWRLVFSHLLTEVDLDDVDSENAGQPEELKRLGCLRKWKSRSGAEATFKVIVEAAISSGRVDNAEAICQQLLREAGALLTSSSVEKVTDDAKSKEVGEKIDRLEKQFSGMQRSLQTELKTKSDITPETLVDSLTFLPVALRLEYQKFVYDNLKTLKKADSIREIFHHINVLVTFIDYGLLKYLIEEFGSYKLKQGMSSYSVAVEDFLDETTVEQLSHHWPGLQDIPPHFERLTAVIDQDPHRYTLRQLDKLRKRFCCQIRLYETVVILIGVGKKNSFVVSWAVPSIFVSQLKSMISSSTSFYKTESFLSVTVGKQRLYSIAAKYEERLLVFCSKGSGQVSEMLSLLEKAGVETNIYDKEGLTPLWWSSDHGRTDLVQLLLDHGADVDLPTDNEWGETPLIGACVQGHLTTATLLIERGANIEYQDKKGQHPLYYAGFYGQMDTVTLLLDSGAQIDLPANNHFGYTALHAACQEGKKEVALLLIGRGAKVEYLNKKGRTPLHTASEHGHGDVVQLLLDEGAIVDRPSEDDLGLTALHLASEAGHPAVVCVLIDKGAKVDYMRKDGRTLLHMASQFGHDNVVQLLIDKGAKIDLPSEDEYGITALNLACLSGHTKVAATLVNRGAAIDYQDKDGETSLFSASVDGHTEVVELLVSCGAQLDIRNKEGRTALSVASWKGHTNIVKILAERGANVDVQDEAGLTPLILAAQKGHATIVKLLLKLKANPNITDIKAGSGWSPAFFAAEQGQLEILRELVGAGANVLLKDKNGNTPLNVARIHSHNDVSDFLQEYSDSEREKEITEDQKKQVKTTSQRLKNVLNFLERSLLRAKVTKQEKQKIAEEREISEHIQLTEVP